MAITMKDNKICTTFFLLVFLSIFTSSCSANKCDEIFNQHHRPDPTISIYGTEGYEIFDKQLYVSSIANNFNEKIGEYINDIIEMREKPSPSDNPYCHDISASYLVPDKFKKSIELLHIKKDLLKDFKERLRVSEIEVIPVKGCEEQVSRLKQISQSLGEYSPFQMHSYSFYQECLSSKASYGDGDQQSDNADINHECEYIVESFDKDNFNKRILGTSGYNNLDIAVFVDNSDKEYRSKLTDYINELITGSKSFYPSQNNSCQEIYKASSITDNELRNEKLYNIKKLIINSYEDKIGQSTTIYNIKGCKDNASKLLEAYSNKNNNSESLSKYFFWSKLYQKCLIHHEKLYGE